MDSKASMFWFGFASATAIFITSGYYLVNYLLEDHDEEEQLEKEQELKFEIEINKDVLTSELSVKIMAYIHQIFQKEFDLMFSDQVAQRRGLINRPNEYEELSKGIINRSDQLFNQAAQKVLKLFKDKFTLNQIQTEIGKLSLKEKERLFFKYDKQQVNKTLTRDQVKKAYAMYHEAFKNEIKTFQNIAKSNLEISEEQQIMLTYKLVIGQLRASDHLFIQYGINDKQLAYLIYDMKLIDDDIEIQQLHKELQEMDDMLTTHIYA